MPRQPGSSRRARPGANSRSEEFSGKDGESVDLVNLATLGGMNQNLVVRLNLWINVRFFRTFVVGSVVDTTPRKLFTSANSILAPWKRLTIMMRFASR